MRCPLVYKSDLVRYVHSLNKSVPISRIRKMKINQLYAIWYSSQKR
jgi:hypothetical protein